MPGSLRSTFLRRAGAARLATLVAVGALAGLAACTSDLDTDVGCPLLCPEQQLELRQVTLEPIALDTSVAGFPLRGEEPNLLVAREGDQLDTRAVFRFDAVPTRYQPLGQDSVPITQVYDAFLKLRLDTLASLIPEGTRLEVYNVDADLADTAIAGLVPLFSPERFLGARTIPTPRVGDTLTVPLDTAAVGAAIRERGRVRLGVLATTPAGTRALVRLDPVSDTLGIDPTPEPNAGLLRSTPASRTPTNNDAIRRSLAAFVVVARGSPALPADALAAGGLPGTRALLRFQLPDSIVDSATVVRAELILTQRPTPGARPGDSAILAPVPVIASDAVTDVLQSLILSGDPGGVRLVDTLRLAAVDSGRRTLEVQQLVSLWRAGTANRPQRALVLRIESEGLNPAQLRFFSNEAPAELRPRLRLTYIPQVPTGLP